MEKDKLEQILECINEQEIIRKQLEHQLKELEKSGHYIKTRLKLIKIILNINKILNIIKKPNIEKYKIYKKELQRLLQEYKDTQAQLESKYSETYEKTLIKLTDEKEENRKK